MSRPAVQRESDVQKAILQYLAARHVMAFRMQTGAIKMDKRFIRFGVPGMADILAFKKVNPRTEVQFWPTTPVWIEVKTGTRQSALQKSFQKMVEAEGHKYAICRSIEDVEAIL